MTRGDAITILDCERPYGSCGCGATDEEIEEALDMAIKALDFAKWVATEIFDDNWEYNKDAFDELACRKLEKLGFVRAKGDEWELIEPQESEEV